MCYLARNKINFYNDISYSHNNEGQYTTQDLNTWEINAGWNGGSYHQSANGLQTLNDKKAEIGKDHLNAIKSGIGAFNGLMNKNISNKTPVASLALDFFTNTINTNIQLGGAPNTLGAIDTYNDIESIQEYLE